jgi:hypothetical protein
MPVSLVRKSALANNNVAIKTQLLLQLGNGLNQIMSSIRQLVLDFNHHKTSLNGLW